MSDHFIEAEEDLTPYPVHAFAGHGVDVGEVVWADHAVCVDVKDGE